MVNSTKKKTTKTALGTLSSSGKVTFTKKGRLIFGIVSLISLTLAATCGYGYIYYKKATSVTGTIQTTIRKSHDEDNVVDITQLSESEITDLVDKAYNDGYETVSLVLMSNACARCQLHKTELATTIADYASHNRLMLIANYKDTDTRTKLENVFNLPDTYYYPTIIDYPKTYQENGSIQDRSSNTNLYDYYTVEPLYQNREIYHG